MIWQNKKIHLYYPTLERGHIMNLTVEEAYKSYESYYKTRSKLRSIDVISSVFRLYILTYFKNRKMCDISKIEILNFEINFLDKQKISYSYKKIIYNHLATFFNYCKKYLDLEKNVVSETGFILKIPVFSILTAFFKTIMVPNGRRRYSSLIP